MSYHLFVQSTTTFPSREGSSRIQLELGIKEMASVRENLLESGMAFDSPMPALPNNLEELKKKLSNHPYNNQGIPIHKLCSNDGWYVTKQECKEAITIYSSKRDLSNVPDEIIDFLQNAASYEGFVVY